MERVIVIRNESPIVLVAPHSAAGDDDLTGFITEEITERINCSCVINQGWRKSDTYDYMASKANCNNIEQCHEDVVREEFLDPIMEIVRNIQSNFNEAQIITVHGFGRQIRKMAGAKIDGVLGYGDVKSMSCESWRKNAFLYCARKNKIELYQGKPGGAYSGATKNNLNQLYRKWYNDLNVHSFQLELVKEIREDKDIAGYTAEILSKCFEDFEEMLKSLEETGNAPVSVPSNWESIGSKCPEF